VFVALGLGEAYSGILTYAVYGVSEGQATVGFCQPITDNSGRCTGTFGVSNNCGYAYQITSENGKKYASINSMPTVGGNCGERTTNKSKAEVPNDFSVTSWICYYVASPPGISKSWTCSSSGNQAAPGFPNGDIVMGGCALRGEGSGCPQTCFSGFKTNALCSITGTTNSDTIPPCSQPVPVDAPECEGGKGLSMTGNEMHIGQKVFEMFGNPPKEMKLVSPGNVNSSDSKATRPDGTECSLFNEGTMNGVNNYLVCPLGDKSSSSSEDNSSSSGCASGVIVDGVCQDSNEDCKSGVKIDGVCQEDPEQDCPSGIKIDGVCQDSKEEKCKVMIGGVCVEYEDKDKGEDGEDGNDGEGGDGGVDIGDANCWATHEAAISTVSKLSAACSQGGGNANYIINPNAYKTHWCVVGSCLGYGVGESRCWKDKAEAQRALEKIVAACQKCGGESSYLLNSGAYSGLTCIFGDCFGGSCILKEAFGFGEEGGTGNSMEGILQGVLDSLGALEGEQTEGEGGKGKATMGDSLGDGLRVKDKIRDKIGIKGEDLNFFGVDARCPVFDLTFDVGFFGLKNRKNINLCDIYGFNAGQTIRAIIWLMVSMSLLFMDLQLLKSGGRS
jgi:hypothetical protein